MILRPGPDNPSPVFDLTDSTRKNTPMQFVAGDDLDILFRIHRRDGQPAKPANSKIRIRITDGVLGSVLFETGWDEAYLMAQDDTGLYKLSVPEQVTELWPEGTYAGGVKVSDTDSTNDLTLYTFFLNVVYRPTSPSRTLPY